MFQLPKTALLNILAVKRGLQYNLAKTLKGHHFMRRSSKFSITIDLEIFNTFFVQSFKKYLKSTYFRTKQKRRFYQTSHYIQKAAILVSQNLPF